MTSPYLEQPLRTEREARATLRPATPFDLKPGAEVIYTGIRKSPVRGVIVEINEVDGWPDGVWERSWDVRLADGTMRWGFLESFQVEVKDCVNGETA